MGGTAILIDPRHRDHDPGPGHPERPERISAIEEMLKDWNGPGLDRVTARTATRDEVVEAHTAALYAKLQATDGEARTRIDSDTATSAGSFEAASLAAGGLLEMVAGVAAGTFRNGFAFVRPPGHHATMDRSMGFCLFNNVAIAASYLRKRFERVAILDFDLHHGNGTEAIFYDDPNVLYLSLHQFPFYPGTGAATDIGRGKGLGFNVNVPLLAGSGDAIYTLAFDEIMVPILREFAPQFLLVSAGFDAHHRDPLGGLHVSESGFQFMADRLAQVATEVADGRLVAVLEGGYDLLAIRDSSEAVLHSLTHEPPHLFAETSRSDAFGELRHLLSSHWQL